MEKVTVFDFDGTLTRCDTFLLFARRCLPWWRLLAASAVSLPWIAAWKLRLVSGSRAKERLFGSLYGGMAAEDFRRKGDEFGHVIDSVLRPEVVAELDRAIASGHRTYIISASLTDWIKPWALSRGVTAVLATRAASDSSGRLTGRFDGPNCIGPEKVRRLLAAEPARATYILTAYGDSSGDSELLAESDHPHWV